jgi:hypothetical protein
MCGDLCAACERRVVDVIHALREVTRHLSDFHGLDKRTRRAIEFVHTFSEAA